MKLFFDARYIELSTQTGIGRYSTELGRALHRIHGEVTFLIHDEGQRAFLPKDANTLLIHAPTSAKEPFTAFTLNKYHPDVVFSPMQTMGSFGRKYKLILTLHDMIYYRHRTPPRQFNWLLRLGWRLYHATYIPQRIALNGADMVATVSHTSKDDILKAKLTKRPIIVTYNAPLNLAEHLKERPVVTETPINLVYMGSFMSYKNVETLIKGMEYLPGYTLHLLSRIRPERQNELTRLIPPGAKVVFHNGVPDEAYAQIMSNRALLVSASLDEGYGLPVAEAMALGVPAVISDIPIFHEVAGDGALYFDPRDPHDFADKIKQTATLEIAQELSHKGFEQSQKFSWHESAHTLLDAAYELVNLERPVVGGETTAEEHDKKD